MFQNYGIGVNTSIKNETPDVMSASPSSALTEVKDLYGNIVGLVWNSRERFSIELTSDTILPVDKGSLILKETGATPEVDGTFGMYAYNTVDYKCWRYADGKWDESDNMVFPTNGDSFEIFSNPNSSILVEFINFRGDVIHRLTHDSNTVCFAYDDEVAKVLQQGTYVANVYQVANGENRLVRKIKVTVGDSDCSDSGRGFNDCGKMGPVGPRGPGIISIRLVSTDGLIDTYEILYSDNKRFTYKVKNGEQGVKGDQGIQGVQGEKGEQGVPGVDGKDGVGVESALVNQNGELVITYTDGGEVNLGKVVGPQGIQGDPGEKGETGADGLTPFINADGNWQIGDTDTGVRASGTNGTNGENGLTPYINADGNWQIGDKDTGIKAAGVNGTNGDSAYDIAKKNGFVGNEEEWLASLKGNNGDNGEDGQSPYIGANGNWFIGESDTGVQANGAVKEIKDSVVYLDKLPSGAYLLAGSVSSPQRVYCWEEKVYSSGNVGSMFIVLSTGHTGPTATRLCFVLYPQTYGVVYLEFCPATSYFMGYAIRHKQLNYITPPSSKTLDSLDSGTYLLMGKYYWDSDKTSYYDTGEATKLCSIIKTSAKVVLSEYPNTMNSTYVYTVSDKSVINPSSGTLTIVEGEVSSIAELADSLIAEYIYHIRPIGYFQLTDVGSPTIVNNASSWSNFRGAVDFMGELLCIKKLNSGTVMLRLFGSTRDYLFSLKKVGSTEYNHIDVFETPVLSRLQSTKNLVTEINGESTDTQYPSAKATYDFVLSSDRSVDEALDMILEIQEELLIPNGDEVKY